ncbi:uncharacterized protein [Lolium perenne]|uniref:uncharacterized protein n=1 Tax=Lolium perenne TaxID=4522 RepID=UPI0021EAA04B|nr:uncharacterized protein LOC127318335 [Lolium perenne]
MKQERQGKCSTAMAAGAPPSLSGTALQQHQAAAYFGLSCALAALRRVAPSKDAGGCDLGARQRQCRWSRAREAALQGKIGELELQVEELRRRRAEDARANEKVAGIFAAHEQRWFAERKSLRRQVQAVVAAARAREVKHDEATAALARRLEDQRREATEQEARRREEAQERLRASEQAAEELRERARKVALEHAADVKRHKASYVELASAQRQLEAELARAARRADLADAELEAALERRDEAVATAAELSLEAARLRRDAEHKDKILSAMLRKSKIDMEDREMLVREVKMCKARRKQAELEAERWRKMWESRHRRGSSRSSAQRCAAVDHTGCSDRMAPDAPDAKILFVDHVEEGKNGRLAPVTKELTTVVDCYGSNVDDKPVVEEYKDLQEWFHMETGKYTSMIRQRHSAELEAFTEQMRLKDEKLEAFRWRAVSMDAEAARLRCRIQELEVRLSQNEQHGAGMEALLLDRENENTSLKEELVAFRSEALDSSEPFSPTVADYEEGSRNSSEHCSPVKIQQLTDSREANHVEGNEIIEPNESSVLINDTYAAARRSIDEGRRVPTDQSCRSEIEEEKEACTDAGKKRARPSSSSAASASSDEARSEAPEHKASACRVDIHALAVSYKIKRLKQQQLVLEKLAADAAAAAAEGGKEGATTSSEANGSGGRQDPRSYQLMISFVSKHVKRYQSLEDKIEGICSRMEESKRSCGRGREGDREQNVALARFLEETFQLQRYMVATGQKLLEMQSRIATTLARAAVAGGGISDGGDGVDTARFMDVVGALLRDVQRGLEVRIARIIGDLEGTLTFHGILHTTF